MTGMQRVNKLTISFHRTTKTVKTSFSYLPMSGTGNSVPHRLNASHVSKYIFRFICNRQNKADGSKHKLQKMFANFQHFIFILLFFFQIRWTSTPKNLSSVVFEQQRRRPACASAQSDQRLCYSLVASTNVSY